MPGNPSQFFPHFPGWATSFHRLCCSGFALLSSRLEYRKTYTPAVALQKARHFCAYQERSHAQVTRKLYGWGLRKADVEQVVASLIEEQYINEERFAVSFAGGKFRMKQWGRVKIAHALKQEQVSAHNLRKALDEIDQAVYLQTLEKLARKKWASISGQGITSLTRRAKTAAYLQQKGFEPALVSPLLKRLAAENRGSMP